MKGRISLKILLFTVFCVMQGGSCSTKPDLLIFQKYIKWESNDRALILYAADYPSVGYGEICIAGQYVETEWYALFSGWGKKDLNIVVGLNKLNESGYYVELSFSYSGISSERETTESDKFVLKAVESSIKDADCDCNSWLNWESTMYSMPLPAEQIDARFFKSSLVSDIHETEDRFVVFSPWGEFSHAFRFVYEASWAELIFEAGASFSIIDESGLLVCWGSYQTKIDEVRLLFEEDQLFNLSGKTTTLRSQNDF